MAERTVQLNEEVIKGEIKELVWSSVEETLNELPEQKAKKLTQAAHYERNVATMTGTLPSPLEMSPSICPASREFLLRITLDSTLFIEPFHTGHPQNFDDDFYPVQVLQKNIKRKKHVECIQAGGLLFLP